MKMKKIEHNFAIGFFIFFFWVLIGKIGLINGIVTAVSLWGIVYTTMNFQKVWRYFHKSLFIYAFILIFIPVVISALDSLIPKDSWKTVLNFLRFLFIGGLIVLLTLPDLKKIRYFLLAFIVLITVDALIEWLTGYHLRGISRDRARIMGLFSFYHLGYCLATLTPVLFYQTYSAITRKDPLKYLWAVMTIMSIVVIFLAGSRAGWVTLIVSIALFVLWLIVQRKLSWKMIAGVFVSIIIIGVTVTQIPMVKTRLVNPNGAAQVKMGSYEWVNKISSDRLVLWEFAWSQYQKYPVTGAGAGSFHITFSSQPKAFKAAHDEAFFPHFHGLEVLSETGTIGFISYMVVVLGVFILYLRSRQFSVWFAITVLAIMPINTHVAFYGSYWAILIWIPLILGLRERYLLQQNACRD